MALLEDTATKLAQRAMELIVKTGDETIEQRVADEIGVRHGRVHLSLVRVTF